ncbi:MAG: sporulation protein YqfD [Oscillospiraceae bacterium]|nr:sporulation protein YqfD [Oscillospiraceae bacterium]
MQNIVNYFCGSVKIEVRGAYPERFFNLCARNGIGFWEVEDVDTGVFRVRMTVSDFRKIRPVARRAMCKIHITEKRGLPFFTNRFRRRILFVVGCALFCIAAWIFTSFIWVINIDGFDGLDTVRLRECLEDAGLYEGRYAANVNIAELRNQVLINMQELSYVSVKFNGSHADVTVRKRILPPEILPESEPCDIVSDKDGIVYDITVKTGTPEVVRGETVVRGQLLASGYITGRTGSTIRAHADADIRLRTWKRMSARMEKKNMKKRYTGGEKTRYTLIVFGNRIKLYTNSGISYAKCDKIIKRNDLAVFGNIKLPLALEHAVLREYVTEENALSDEEAYGFLGDGLHERLSVSEDAEVADVDFVTSSDEKFAYATLTAECIEKAGIKREILKEE